MTAYGRQVAEEVATTLARNGVTIVSGLARGVDAAAHRGALAGKGRTIAVLGCGIDRTYPSENQALRRSIESHGAVISELPIGAAPQSHHFPRRNRIISGLSLGVLVSEAATNSGSLITAKLALEQGREVFAVPGSIKEEACRGSNRLIKEGAKLIEGAQDVLDEHEQVLTRAFDDAHILELRGSERSIALEQLRVGYHERRRDPIASAAQRGARLQREAGQRLPERMRRVGAVPRVTARLPEERLREERLLQEERLAGRRSLAEARPPAER